VVEIEEMNVLELARRTYCVCGPGLKNHEEHFSDCPARSPFAPPRYRTSLDVLVKRIRYGGAKGRRAVKALKKRVSIFR
jgi:hypothetical protein